MQGAKKDAVEFKQRKDNMEDTETGKEEKKNKKENLRYIGKRKGWRKIEKDRKR